MSETHKANKNSMEEEISLCVLFKGTYRHALIQTWTEAAIDFKYDNYFRVQKIDFSGSVVHQKKKNLNLKKYAVSSLTQEATLS